MDARKQELVNWLESIGKPVDSIEPASADASFRRYFRVYSDGERFIVMDAPPDREDISPFIRIAGRFLEIGLNVPSIFRQERERGFLLMSDLGSNTYLQALNPDSADRLYGDALSALLVLQQSTYSDPAFLPPYDRQLLLNEMTLFPEWLLKRHLGLRLSEAQQGSLRETFNFLAANALEQPSVWVHRDYHSRNLMVSTNRNPGILDFQDAVCGPVTYDLVSLLRDCYINWPPDRVEEWVKDYHQLALGSGIPVPEDVELFLRWFDLMGVQRHLKAAGIFARLYHRDGKSGYLADIPRTLAYIGLLRNRYPELGPLTDLIDSLDQSGIASIAGAP
jgi:aminoglycoside/choline kinase family phosphotransferase